MLLGWVRYYGRFRPSALRGALRTLDSFIVRWAQRKYKKLRTHKLRAWDWLRRLKTQRPTLFAHVSHARRSIGNYLNWYNQNRPHSRLADQTPDEAYFATLPAIKSAA
ncbi:integrase core domain-containing protein [Paraburkholderia guartelaensis]|uniref:integrase core domain-containing protein n=1 Tax=Paraburkholderia guartelaensis TaxID=2546446 RepID=UPI003879CA07